MNRRIFLAMSLPLSFGLALSAVADSPPADQAPETRSPVLDGTWDLTSIEQVGRKLEGDDLPTPMRGMKRVFDKQRMTIKRVNREYECTYTVDNDKTPKQMDVIIETEGKPSRTLKCIYEIKRNTLRLAESRQDRPASFETDPTMRRVIVYTFTRQP